MTRTETKEMVVMIAGIVGLVILGLTMAIFLPLLLSGAYAMLGLNSSQKAFHLIMR